MTLYEAELTSVRDTAEMERAIWILNLHPERVIYIQLSIWLLVLALVTFISFRLTQDRNKLSCSYQVHTKKAHLLISTPECISDIIPCQCKKIVKYHMRIESKGVILAFFWPSVACTLLTFG